MRFNKLSIGAAVLAGAVLALSAGAAQADDHFLEATFANIVSRSQNQGTVSTGLVSRDLLMDFPGELIGIKEN